MVIHKLENVLEHNHRKNRNERDFTRNTHPRVTRKRKQPSFLQIQKQIYGCRGRP